MNGILNSKLFQDALEQSKKSLIDFNYNQSNAAYSEKDAEVDVTRRPRKSSVRRITSSRTTFSFSPSSFAKKDSKRVVLKKVPSPTEQTQQIPELVNDNPAELPGLIAGARQGVITNASFQSIRPPEDIPVIVSPYPQEEGDNRDIDHFSSTSHPFNEIVPDREEDDQEEEEREESHCSSQLDTFDSPCLPPYFQKLKPDPSLPKCASIERRTHSFNAKVSGGSFAYMQIFPK